MTAAAAASALVSAGMTPQAARQPSGETTEVFGVPFVRWTMGQTLDWVDAAVAAGQPRQLITANLHTCMVAAERRELAALMRRRETVTVADGMPMVWASKRMPRPLPERIAGSELIFRLAERAAERRHRLFLLGGREDVLAVAAAELRRRCPGLIVAGTESPPFRPLSDEEDAALCDRIREADADILLVAMGQPKGELWLAERRERLGVPVGIQLGASFDFVAGRVRRAPKWVQRTGAEWLFRLAMEPRRLVGRYARNLAFLLRAGTVGVR